MHKISFAFKVVDTGKLDTYLFNDVPPSYSLSIQETIKLKSLKKFGTNSRFFN